MRQHRTAGDTELVDRDTKKPMIFCPASKMTAHMTVENRVILIAKVRCSATEYPSVIARNTGKFTNGFMMAKNAPKALTINANVMFPLRPGSFVWHRQIRWRRTPTSFRRSTTGIGRKFLELNHFPFFFDLFEDRDHFKSNSGGRTHTPTD